MSRLNQDLTIHVSRRLSEVIESKDDGYIVSSGRLVVGRLVREVTPIVNDSYQRYSSHTRGVSLRTLVREEIERQAEILGLRKAGLYDYYI